MCPLHPRTRARVCEQSRIKTTDAGLPGSGVRHCPVRAWHGRRAANRGGRMIVRHCARLFVRTSHGIDTPVTVNKPTKFESHLSSCNRGIAAHVTNAQRTPSQSRALIKILKHDAHTRG